MFEFLQGRIDLATLLKGKVVGSFFQREENLALTLERKNRARGKIEEGRRQLARGQVLLAGEAFDEAVEWDKDNAEGWFLSAMCRILCEGDLEEVLSSLRRAIELDPENPNFTLALAEIQAELGRPAEAVANLHQTIRIDPSNHRAKAMLHSLGGLGDHTVEEGGIDERA